ncbi:hypothetical protein [Romboutsia lituseburensis]|uniref:Uncharacterized protein n=1 Tax=Romboutsia lituseburensis DSM 797 TaxID=1121325 RepID=A0A1G9MQL2_9FIRM|nr:hypothetical protein [Romboutsia lituseburensis]CEH34365.1 Hypothetical protein RLITU_1777 [Romboutsia lituseburensis]SDL76311.1 hypothetical protein SAMN04515677_103312 [Romboutsia lituseburensis DSM 797]
MKLTEKQLSTITIVSTFCLLIFDSLFLPNASFNLFKLVANIFIIIFLIRLINSAISEIKSKSKVNVVGFIVTFILVAFMFKVVNF